MGHLLQSMFHLIAEQANKWIWQWVIWS